ncbi:MAG: efflux RND transporter permease subunit, partial [Pseudomonadota bacterium]
ARRLAGVGLAINDVWLALKASAHALPIAAVGSAALRLPNGESISVAEVAHVEARVTQDEHIRHRGIDGLLVRVVPQERVSLSDLMSGIDAQIAWLQSNRLQHPETRVSALTDPARLLRVAIGDAFLALLLIVGITAVILWVACGGRDVLSALVQLFVAATLSVTVGWLLHLPFTPLGLTGASLGALFLVAWLAVAQREDSEPTVGSADRGPRILLPATAMVALLLVGLALWLTPYRALLVPPAILWCAAVPVRWLFGVARPGGVAPFDAVLDSRRPLRFRARWAAWAGLFVVVAVPWLAITDTFRANAIDRIALSLRASGPIADAEVATLLERLESAVARQPYLEEVVIIVRRPRGSGATTSAVLHVRASSQESAAKESWTSAAADVIAQLRVALPDWQVATAPVRIQAAEQRLELLGPNSGGLTAFTAQTISALNATAGITRATFNKQLLVPAVEVQPDADRLEELELGLDAGDIERAVSLSGAGLYIGEVVDGDNRQRVFLRLSRPAGSREDAAEVLLAGEIKGRAAVRLGAVAQTAVVSTPFSIERVDGRYAAYIDVGIDERFSARAGAPFDANVSAPSSEYQARWAVDETVWKAASRDMIAATAVLALTILGFAVAFMRSRRTMVATIISVLAVAVATAGTLHMAGTVEISAAWLGGILAVCFGAGALGLGTGQRTTLTAPKRLSRDLVALPYFAAVSGGMVPHALGWTNVDPAVQEVTLFLLIGTGAALAVALWFSTHASDLK